MVLHQGGPPSYHGAALDHGLDAEAGVVDEAFHVRKPAKAPSSSLGYGPGDRVLAGALGRRRQAQYLFLAGARRRDDGADAHNAVGQRPRLVQGDDRDVPGLFQDLGAFDDDPELGAAPGADE